MFNTLLPHEIAGQPDRTPSLDDEHAHIIEHEAVSGPFVSNFAGYRGIYQGRLTGDGRVVKKIAPIAAPVKTQPRGPRVIGQR